MKKTNRPTRRDDGVTMESNALDRVRDIRAEIDTVERKPRTRDEALQWLAIGSLKDATMHLMLAQNVSTLVTETMLFQWWIKLSCLQHGKGVPVATFLLNDRFSTLYKAVIEGLDRLSREVEDRGPSAMHAALADAIEDARHVHAAFGSTKPKDAFEDMAQRKRCNDFLIEIHNLLLKHMQERHVAPAMLYVWFRLCCLNRNFREGFFQKLERNWDLAVRRAEEQFLAFAEGA